MGRVADMLDQLRTGQLTLDEAEAFCRRFEWRLPPPPPQTPEQIEEWMLADFDPPLPTGIEEDSVAEIQAAWTSGRLSDEQYRRLYDAVG